MPDFATTSTSGVEVRGYRRGTLTTDDWDQYVIPVRDRITTYLGRANTFQTLGRAGTVGQKLIALHNAAGSPVLVCVNRLRVDMLNTVIKGILVIPPIIRCVRFTAVPTNGTVLAKVPLDTSLTSDSAVTCRGDASADITGSGTTLTVTIPAGSNLSQVYAPRFVTAVGYEPIDTALFFEGDSDITLRPSEGVAIFLDYIATTSNPTTDRWVGTIDWEEYTRP